MIPSSFGRRVPRSVKRGGPEKKNPLGKRVEPSIKKPGAKIVPGTAPSLGVRVEPSVKSQSQKSGPSRKLQVRVQSPAKVFCPPIISPGNVPPIPSHEIVYEPRFGIAIVGRFVSWPWGQHPDEAYLADALEHLGVTVYRVNQDLFRQTAQKAEWALFTGHPGSWRHLDTWRRTHPNTTIVWTLDWLPDFPDRKPMIEAGRRAALFLSSDQYDWRGYGIRSHGYLPGACEASVAPFSPKPEIPCAFIGSLYSPRRKQIASLVKKHGGVVLDQAGSWKYGMELSAWLQTVKVLVGDSYRNDVQGYWSTRNYIVPGAGGFLLTPRTPGLELQFKIDREIAIYESLGDLDVKLNYWIKNDAERERVRRAGYDRVRREHCWESRAKSLLMHLAGKVNATS